VGRLQEELTDASRKQWIAEKSLKASTLQRDYLKEENSRLQEDLDKAKAKVCKVCKPVSMEEAVPLLQRVPDKKIIWEQIQERLL